MLNIHRLIRVLSVKQGEPYDLHQQIPLWDQAWNGPWNCSAFLAWGLWQAGDRRMLGCRPYPPTPDSKATFPKWWKTGRIWAWTEWFYEDLERHAVRVSENEAVQTPGIIGMYRPHEMEGHPIGHIAVSLGGNRIVEAHGRRHHAKHGNAYGPDPGVIAYRSMGGRFAHWYKLQHSQAA
jgi:hypothetical protein